jgi:hypothetical protein
MRTNKAFNSNPETAMPLLAALPERPIKRLVPIQDANRDAPIF